MVSVLERKEGTIKYEQFFLLPFVAVNDMFGVYIKSLDVMLQMLQLNPPQYVTNVALISLATFILYNGITIII